MLIVRKTKQIVMELGIFEPGMFCFLDIFVKIYCLSIQSQYFVLVPVDEI